MGASARKGTDYPRGREAVFRVGFIRGQCFLLSCGGGGKQSAVSKMDPGLRRGEGGGISFE
jgi:hypothetical protein